MLTIIPSQHKSLKTWIEVKEKFGFQAWSIPLGQQTAPGSYTAQPLVTWGPGQSLNLALHSSIICKMGIIPGLGSRAVSQIMEELFSVLADSESAFYKCHLTLPALCMYARSL